MANKDKKWGWIAEYVAYSLIVFLFRFIPVSVCYRAGELLGILMPKLMPKRKRSVFRNLRIAFGKEKSKAELEELMNEVFKCTSGNLLASVKTATMSVKALKKCLTIEGADEVEKYVRENDGGIYLLPHMGNWEVCARLNEIVYPDLPNGGMYRPLNNPHIDKIVKRRREFSGTSLFARNDGMSAPLQLIRKPGFLGILADQRVGKPGQVTPFFGRLTSFSPLPQIFKKRTKCCIVGIAVITTAPGKWTVRYTLEADKQTDLNTGDVAAIMEKLMRMSPKDCFWLQDRWRMENKPLALLGKTPVIKPLIYDHVIKKQNYAIYLDKVDDSIKKVLEQLQQHRTDIQLISFIADDSNITSPPTQNFTACPSIADSAKFLEFMKENDETQYVDLIIVPNTFDKSIEHELLTRICPVDYSDLEASVKALGLPEKAIA